MKLTYDDYLAHYGVKGMRWGVRREPKGTHSVGESSGSRESTKKQKTNRRKVTGAALAAVGTMAVATIAYSAKRKRDRGRILAAQTLAKNLSQMNIYELAAHLDKNPTTRVSKTDSKIFGSSGAARIANRVARGYTPKEARVNETARQTAAMIARTVTTPSRRNR